MRILLFVLLLPVAAAAQSTIEASETARFQAQIARDTQALDRLLGGELVYIHSNGLTESKPDFIRSVASGRIQYLAMEAEPGRNIRIFRRTGISDGVVAVKVSLNNSDPLSLRLRYTAVYLKKDGLWCLVSWQSTRLLD